MFVVWSTHSESISLYIEETRAETTKEVDPGGLPEEEERY